MALVRIYSMADIFSKAERSRIMAAIKSKGNRSTEKAAASLFRKNKLNGWRSSYALPGTPDFAFPKKRLVVFTDGCFWHGCRPCKSLDRLKKPWVRKITANRARDRRDGIALRRMGWKVLRVWEHQFRRGPDSIVARVREAMRSRPK